MDSVICRIAGCATVVLIAVALCMWCAMGVTNAQATSSASHIPGAIPSDFEFVEVDDGLMITRYTGDDVELAIPSNISGEHVVAVASGAFEGCSGIVRVWIPSSVSRVQPGAFAGCDALSEVVVAPGPLSVMEELPQGCVVHVLVDMANLEPATDGFGLEFERVDDGWRVTRYNGNQTSVTIPATYEGEPVVAIGDEAFKGCQDVVSVEIPEGIRSIGNETFSDCSSLREVELPDTLQETGWSVFNGCSSLTSVRIPASLARIEDTTFAFCTSLERVVVPEGVTQLGFAAFSHCDSLTSVELPDTLEVMGSYAFNACISLKTVRLSASLREIAEYSFSGCHSLETVLIPASVERIDETAFVWCYSLGRIDVDEDNQRFAGCDGSLYDTVDHVLLRAAAAGATQVAVEPGTLRVGKCAFAGNTSVERVDIPASVLEMGERNFEYCHSLRDVRIAADNPNFAAQDGMVFDKQFIAVLFTYGNLSTYNLPESVLAVAPFAFFGNEGLVSIDLPFGVTNLGEYSFAECTSLSSVGIPDSVSDIGRGAFSGCTALTQVSLPASLADEMKMWGAEDPPFPNWCEITVR